MKRKNLFLQKRWTLISWLVLPIIFLWLTVSYFIGILNQPSWDINPSKQSVRAAPQNNPAPLPEYKKNKFKWEGSGLVTLWFDDAWLSQYTIALPLMNSYGYKGAIAVATNLVSGTYPGYLNWDQLKAFQKRDWEITAHTRRHQCWLKNVKPQELKSDIVGSLQDLQEEGFYVENYVSPCGEKKPEIINLTKEYFRSFRTSDDGLNNIPVVTPYNLSATPIEVTTKLDDVQKALNEASLSHKWIILVFHKIDNSHERYSIPPEEFKKILNMVKQSNMPVVVPAQALEI